MPNFYGQCVFLGWHSEAMWVGLKTADSTVACSTPKDCQGQLLHVSGSTSWTFDDNDFMDRGLDIDGSVGGCVVMRNAKPPYNTSYMMVSKDCDEKVRFVCARGCQGFLLLFHY